MYRFFIFFFSLLILSIIEQIMLEWIQKRIIQDSFEVWTLSW